MERVRSYSKVKNALHDLKTVVDKDYEDVANAALNHLDEMDIDYRFHWSKNYENFKALADLFEFQFKHVVSFYLKHNGLIKDFKLNIENRSFSLNSWNKTLGELDLFSRLLVLFPLKNHLKIELKNEMILVTSEIFKSDVDLDKRGMAYKLTRDYLKAKQWLTYSITESDSHYAQVTFKIDLSHNEGREYLFEVRQKSFLSFSASIKNYQVTFDKIDSHLEHMVLEVDENCQLQIHNQISELPNLENGQFSLFHFPFLFRPVSLIIPTRGILGEKADRSQDREIVIAEIDFFDAFNK